MKALAKKRGLDLWATFGDGRLQFMDNYGINFIINPQNDSFELSWMIPNTIFTINCPSCSPFSDDNHFHKFYRKFKRVVWTCKDALFEE